MSLTASLPWYDLPTRTPKLDAFWSVLRKELVLLGAPVPMLPDALDRHTPLVEQWASAGLLLSQCCGPDLFTSEARGLVPVARPVFADLDCTPGHYFSYIVSASGRDPGRRQSASPVRFVINSASSRSGCAALFEWAGANGIDGDQVRISGAHAASLECLRSGTADLAAIDAHSWPLLDSRGITIIGRSTEAPTPPFVMHQNNPIGAVLIQEALHSALRQAGAAINIEGVIHAHRQTYQPVAAPWHARLPVGASPCCALI